VVVVEYAGIWTAAHAVTIPYDPAFRLDTSRKPYYCGASLPAFVALGRAKGYRLIGQESVGINAFFLRNDVGADLFPEVSAATCLGIPRPRGEDYAPPWDDDYPWGAERPWVRV
jgi:hypothetical protein